MGMLRHDHRQKDGGPLLPQMVAQPGRLEVGTYGIGQGGSIIAEPQAGSGQHKLRVAAQFVPVGGRPRCAQTVLHGAQVVATGDSSVGQVEKLSVSGIHQVRPSAVREI